MRKKATLPFEAYRGDEPYIFVSYAHSDREQVYPEIARLHHAGYRVWYDEGITPGQEWTEEIGQALRRASYFLVYISARSVASHNVRNEINFALEHPKPFLAVHLEETRLPAGLQLQIGSIQAIMKYQIPDDRYTRKLFQVLGGNVREGRAAESGFVAVEAPIGRRPVHLWVPAAAFLLILFTVAAIKFWPLLLQTDLTKSNLKPEWQTNPDSLKSRSPDLSDLSLNPMNESEKAEKENLPEVKTVSKEETARNQLLQEINQTKQDMFKAKSDVPGDQTERDQDENYQTAMTKSQGAEAQLNANDLQGALKLFGESRDLFVKSKDSILRTRADHAETSLAQTKENIDVSKTNYNEQIKQKYDEAINLETEGHLQFKQQKYDLALEKYGQGIALFAEVQSDIQRFEQSIHDGIKRLIEDFKTSVERGNIEDLRKLFTRFVKPQEQKWEKLFAYTSDRLIDIATQKIDLRALSPVVELSVRLTYVDNKNKEQQNSWWYTWTLAQENGKWLIDTIQEK